MYAKSIRPRAKREVQKERSAKCDNQIARPHQARSNLRAMKMYLKADIFNNLFLCSLIRILNALFD